MKRVLKIRLNMPDGKALTYTIADPKDGLTEAQIKAIFDDMLTESVIYKDDMEPTGFRDAYIYETNTIEIE